MCAIAGIAGYNNGIETVVKMLQAMHHRGPDDRGVFSDNMVILGHNRLSIIDLSKAGHQPMSNSRGNFTIVYNGEIYNYQELKSLLPDHVALKSNTDTEVIVELWNLLGIKLLQKLRGMFAIAIWDHEKQQLVLARDHMGIKPLYYTQINDKIVFASEMKGMLASGLISKKINTKALSDYLANGYIVQPDTIVEDVHMLPPASYLLWDGTEMKIKTYWNFTDIGDYQPNTEEEAIVEVKQLLTDAVKEETISDRPLGVFLSGGLDSAILVSVLKQSGFSEINTYSIGFEGDDLSEEKEALEAAQFFNTKHLQIQVSDKDIVPYIDEFIKALDQPSVDGLNTWLVSKVTSKYVTVALSGLGGDELFSGYSIDRDIIHKQKYLGLSKFLSATQSLWVNTPNAISKRLSAYSKWKNLSSFYQTWGDVFNSKEIKKLTGNFGTHFNQFESLNLPKKYSLLQQISFFHLRGFMMSRLLRDSDAVSMHHSIEVRFPFIDYRLVTLAFHLPDQWKIKFVGKTANLSNFEKQYSYEANGVKHILYQAFKNDLYENFGLRPKRGFKIPVENWMKKGLLVDIERTLTGNTYLENTHIKKIVEEWKSGKTNWTRVWSLYIFEKWVQQNLK